MVTVDEEWQLKGGKMIWMIPYHYIVVNHNSKMKKNGKRKTKLCIEAGWQPGSNLRILVEEVNTGDGIDCC